MDGRLQGRERAVLRATQDDIYGVDAMPQKGFTLIELMITIAVLAIVLGVAVPSFSSMLRGIRAFLLADKHQRTSRFARSAGVLTRWRAMPGYRWLIRQSSVPRLRHSGGQQFVDRTCRSWLPA
ncbi:putative major pilin subunit [compost metagenome]